MSLLDPRLLGTLAEFWPSRCTIQSIVFTTSDSGQQEQTGAEDVVGLANIPCRVAVSGNLKPSDTPILESNVRGLSSRRVVKLKGYFPAINPLTAPQTMQAVIDGVAYPITGVEQDSQSLSTRLRVEVIKP